MHQHASTCIYSGSQGLVTSSDVCKVVIIPHRHDHGVGGDANLAFREDEELKPYKKKIQASLYSASLSDESFTIPAWKDDALPKQTGESICQSPPSSGSLLNDGADRSIPCPMHGDIGLEDDTNSSSVPLHAQHAAARPMPSVADTASLTSLR